MQSSIFTKLNARTPRPAGASEGLLEVNYHGPEGVATAQTRHATLFDFCGYYEFDDPGFHLLFWYGHTVEGQRKNYDYLGLY